MVLKKYKNSEVNWDNKIGVGLFTVTSNRGQSAKGVVKKSSDGKLIALIESTDYANSYVFKKVRNTLNTIFNDFPEDVVVQGVIDCLSDNIYTDASEANGLSPNDSHIISGSYMHYCVNGAYDCGGETYQGPTSVTYIGTVIGVCAGLAIEYAKFKIN